MEERVVVKTVVHLSDSKRRMKEIEHSGSRDFDGMYIERRLCDPNNPGELLPDSRRYYLASQWLELIGEEKFVKHSFFVEG